MQSRRHHTIESQRSPRKDQSRLMSEKSRLHSSADQKKTHRTSVNPPAPESDLHQIAAKLNGLAHLIECQGAFQCEPSDPQKVYWGLSLILAELSDQLNRISEKNPNMQY